MPQARGIKTNLFIYDETAYKTTPGSPDARKLYYRSFSVVPSQETLDSEQITGDRARARPDRGNIDAGGDLVTEINAESLSYLLKHAIGAPVTTGVGPYTHAFEILDLPVGMLLEKDNGAAIAGSGRFERYQGARIATYSFEFPQSGYCLATFAVRGAKHAPQAATLDATPSDPGNKSFSSFRTAVLEEGGATIATVTRATINGDNDLDDGVYTIDPANPGERRELPEGFATISGEIEAVFESYALIQKAIDGTESSLRLTLRRGTGAGSADNEEIEFLVQQLLYDRTSAPIDGPRGLRVTLPFKAYRNTAGTTRGLKVTVKNQLATI